MAFCLGHQVIAQALGGLVRPRGGTFRHYGLQASRLLTGSSEGRVSPAGSIVAAAAAVAASASASAFTTATRLDDTGCPEGQGGGTERASEIPLPPLKLLYDHNDEVGDRVQGSVIGGIGTIFGCPKTHPSRGCDGPFPAWEHGSLSVWRY